MKPADDPARRETFSWSVARQRLDGLPGGGINIAHEAVTRHARGPHADAEAIRFIDREGNVTPMTYRRLEEESSKFANVLASLGVETGERVFGLTGRIPPLYVAVIGTLKHRGVFSPLFSAFGPEPICARMTIGSAAVLVTTAMLYNRKVAPIRDRLPSLRHVLIADAADPLPPDTLSLSALMARASDDYTIGPTDPEDVALLHFTSGTTGKPKGAIHVHQAVVAHDATGRFALDLRAGDRYFCTADPGWVTGTSYGIIAPLTNRVTMIVDEGEFNAERWYRILAEQKVAVWYTAPTAIRMLMRAGADIAEPFDLGALRFAASVGEPLNPEAVLWGNEKLGISLHDNWWQTETGAILIANDAGTEIKPGSMGRPLPCVEVALVRRDGDQLEIIEDDDVEGELAIARGWPSMFRGYLDEEERYQKCFVGKWYLTGDLARRDSDGYYWFVGRADDMIKSAGHLIGPFEVESALIEHPAVVEAAAIGVPNDVAMNVVKAFVALHPSIEPTAALNREILAFARKRLGPAVAPRQIAFADSLPKTRSGKIMRRLLRARELGLPEGDTSSLESVS